MSTTYKFWLANDAELTKHELDNEPDVTIESDDRGKALDEAVARLRDTYYVAESGSPRDTLLCQEGGNWYLITLTVPARSLEVFTRLLWRYEAVKFFKEAP